MIRTLVLLVLAGACVAGPRLRAADEPLKLGSVWLRSFDEAAKAAQKEGKPILLLFQEAPACVACEGAGS
ncbi:MAG: hypothetical protein KIS92_18955, partial [Planctomycetota bacterium]|nr:hypothetical protein [Planctomycetota bacterium]